MAEVLNLSLGELPDSDQASPGRDFISVGLPNLRGCKGQLAAIVIQQVPARITAGFGSAHAHHHTVAETAA